MARHKLRDTTIASKSIKPGRYGDGDGLWLYVRNADSKSWVFITIRNGRRHEIGLGSYGNIPGKISLSEARKRADEAREIVKAGGDVARELPHRRNRIKVRSFGDCADDLIATQEGTFRNAKHIAQWKMTLAEYAKPLRKLPVNEVSTADVVNVLRPMWRDKNATATRLRGRIEKVLDYAKAMGLRSGENPARWKGHLDHILGRQDKLQRSHHAAMPYADLPAFMASLRASKGLPARALELCILTATRSGEVLGAPWTEIDMDATLWIIPAARMKAGKEHIVPLSKAAMDILTKLREQRLSDFVFPGRAPRKPLSKMTMTLVMQRLDAGHFTVHGFRSAFRDWAGDATNFPRDVAEMALAHRVGDETEIAYRRSSAIAKRRKLMDAWAAFIGTPKGGENVVAMRGLS